MPCFAPNLAFRHKHVKQPLRFVGRKHYRLSDGTDAYRSPLYLSYAADEAWEPLALPCGQCTWCRLQNSKDKAIRLFHESLSSEDNCFLTLTYSPECIPVGGAYSYDHIRNFMKRLRFHNSSLKIKSFGCAEYGETFSRPHFHLCLFGFNFKDRYPWRMSENDWSDVKWPVCRSSTLEKLWPYGYSEIGTLTLESAQYVARYVMKKVSGKRKSAHYKELPPERCVCVSRGIGLKWLEKYRSELVAHDGVMFKGVKQKLPRYYEDKLLKFFPVDFALVKARRLCNLKKIDMDGTEKRLKARERICELKSQRLVRGFEK